MMEDRHRLTCNSDMHLEISLKHENEGVSLIACEMTMGKLDDSQENLTSPPFEFENATWRFRLEFIDGVADNGEEDPDFMYILNVFLERIDSQIPEHTILSTVTFLEEGCRNWTDKIDATVFDEYNWDEEIAFLQLHQSVFSRDGPITVIVQLFVNKSAGMADECNGQVADKSANIQENTRDVEILSQDFKKLLLDGKKHDLILKVADKEFPVHRNILAARCPGFESILTRGKFEKNKGVIVVVPDCEPQAFKQILSYLYSAKLESLNLENVFGLYSAADKYNIMPIKDKCTEFLKKSLAPSVICEVLKLALKHKDADLLECATKYFIGHTSDILITSEWMSFLNSNSATANELLIKASKGWKGVKQ